MPFTLQCTQWLLRPVQLEKSATVQAGYGDLVNQHCLLLSMHPCSGFVESVIVRTVPITVTFFGKNRTCAAFTCKFHVLCCSSHIALSYDKVSYVDLLVHGSITDSHVITER